MKSCFRPCRFIGAEALGGVEGLDVAVICAIDVHILG